MKTCQLDVSFQEADIPIVLDASSITNLKEEYLLNSNGNARNI